MEHYWGRNQRYSPQFLLAGAFLVTPSWVFLITHSLFIKGKWRHSWRWYIKFLLPSKAFALTVSAESYFSSVSTSQHYCVFLLGVTSGKGWYRQNAENEDDQIPDTGVSEAAFQAKDNIFTIIGNDLCFLHLSKLDNFMCSQETKFLKCMMIPVSNVGQMFMEKWCWVLHTLHLSLTSCYKHLFPTPYSFI